MLRRSLYALALALLPAALLAQTPAEVAEREKERRRKIAASPGPAYTNDDLQKREGAPGSKPSPAASPGGAPAAGAAAGGWTPPGPSAEEQVWRARVAAARAVITGIDSRIAAIQARIDALAVDRNPNEGVADPFRLQTREAEKGKAIEELAKAKEKRQGAQQALLDLEEEARRKSVPPGWLREPQ